MHKSYPHFRGIVWVSNLWYSNIIEMSNKWDSNRTAEALVVWLFLTFLKGKAMPRSKGENKIWHLQEHSCVVLVLLMNS